MYIPGLAGQDVSDSGLYESRLLLVIETLNMFREAWIIDNGKNLKEFWNAENDRLIWVSAPRAQ